MSDSFFGKVRVRGRALVVLAIIVSGMALTLAAQQAAPPPQRTLFNEIPPNDPKRQIIQSVLDSSFYSMRSGFSSSEWTTGHYGGAWERARQYFPNHVFYTSSQQHFMTHFFNPNGKLEMEIFDSAYLRLCLANQSTFTGSGVVGSYQGMLANDPGAAAAFQQKLGHLEAYFRNEADKDRLKGMIGDKLFDRLLDELRRENHHMFAGALLHEGMHAEMDDDALVAAIQNEYSSCKLPVQWDELRAYMSEINYHSRFYNWAVNDLFASWREINDLLRELEDWRKRPKPLSEADKQKIEAIKAKIKAYIALIRLRMREIWQSAQRMQGLMGSFRQDHLKPNAPAGHQDIIRAVAVAVADFVVRVGQEIQRQELLLRELEQYLDLWNKWASCQNPSPPPAATAKDIIRRVRATRWPAPPSQQAEDLRKKAEEEIGKIPGSLPGPSPGQPGGRTGEGGRGRGSGGSGRRFSLSASYLGSSPSLGALNGYLDYLNSTWDGDLPAFGWEHGFGLTAGWRLSPALEAGMAYERTAASVSGTLEAVGSRYTSAHAVNSYGLYLMFHGPEITPAVRPAARAGLAYWNARYTETENGAATAGSDGAVGWSAAAGLEFELTPDLTLSVLGGYGQATMNDFGVSFFLPGAPPVRLELSGLQVRAGLSVRF